MRLIKKQTKKSFWLYWFSHDLKGTLEDQEGWLCGSCLGPKQHVFCWKGGNWKEGCPSSLQISPMRDSCIPSDGAPECLSRSTSHLIHPHDSRGAVGHSWCGGKQKLILVNTGASCSVLAWLAGPVSNPDCTVMVTDRQPMVRQFISPLACRIRSIIITPFYKWQNALTIFSGEIC